MKLCLIVVSIAMVGCGGGAISTSAEPPPFVHDYVGCTNDLDCQSDGGNTACGTEVCSWADAKVHMCVAAGTDPGWCGDPNLPQDQANQTCKCFDAGATCNTTTNFCSFTQAP